MSPSKWRLFPIICICSRDGSGFGGGITTRHYISKRRWDFRFYEFMTSDGSIAPDGSRIALSETGEAGMVAERGADGIADYRSQMMIA